MTSDPATTTRPPVGGGNVGQNITADNGRWTFGGKVADSFEDHIARSVPHYREGHDLVAKISDWFLHPGAVGIEIGCSTGALIRRVADWHSGTDLRLVGLEVEAEMVAAAQTQCAGDDRIDIRHEDALIADLDPADFVMSYYTMQFIPPARRQMMFDRVFETLNWGGAFVMFEKVRAPDARFQDMMTTLYADFKLDQGFAPDEIVHKTRSLKGVLEPFSTQGNLDMLARAGFKDVTTVFKHICFEGFLAIK